MIMISEIFTAKPYKLHLSFCENDIHYNTQLSFETISKADHFFENFNYFDFPNNVKLTKCYSANHEPIMIHSPSDLQTDKNLNSSSSAKKETLQLSLI